MKKVLFVLIPLLFVASTAFALVTGDTVTLSGTIIDTESANNHQDELDDFVASYTKDDALQPEAIARGYSIYLQDSYMNFDVESTPKIVDFLRQPDTTLAASVNVVVKDNNILSLVSISKQSENF